MCVQFVCMWQCDATVPAGPSWPRRHSRMCAKGTRKSMQVCIVSEAACVRQRNAIMAAAGSDARTPMAVFFWGSWGYCNQDVLACRLGKRRSSGRWRISVGGRGKGRGVGVWRVCALRVWQCDAMVLAGPTQRRRLPGDAKWRFTTSLTTSLPLCPRHHAIRVEEGRV